MRSRRQAREAALQALYQCDTLGDWGPVVIQNFFERFTDERETKAGAAEIDHFQFCRKLIDGVIAYIDFIDRNIGSASTHWNIGRMSRVDRNILRIAVFEIGFLEEIPTSVSINEAIEVAKRFGSDDSPMFVNGVLDRLATIFQENPQLVADLALRPARRVAANG